MIIKYSKSFVKQAEKLEPKLQKRIYERMRLFRDNPLHPGLRNHVLKGKYKNYRSIDITGDIRALYREKEGMVVFGLIGTHSQLYD